MDAVFAALASEPRRRILDVLKNGVCAFFDDMGRVAVMKHLAALESANLVVSGEGRGRRLLWFNPVPIHMIYDRWTRSSATTGAGRLARMKYTLENAPVPIKARKGGPRG